MTTPHPDAPITMDAPATPARDQRPPSSPLALIRWLSLVAALVVAIVIVGGITRLTESGLSITQWNPVTGAIPPLNDAQWQDAFAQYRATTEYQTVNRNMTLDAFKQIFFWEWFHRLLGRLIGLALALPLAWFWIKGRIPVGYRGRLLALLALVGFQGALGWWMVSSGLVGRTDVSQYRLAAHLGTALLLLAALVWTIAELRAGAGRARLRGLPLVAVILLFSQLLLGAFVAGMDGGWASASWPKMGEDFLPTGAELLTPHWRNLTDSPVWSHFVHRWWAWAVAVVLLLLALRVRAQGAPRLAGVLLMLLGAQIALGIWTVLSGVHLHVAVAHQGCAALLVVATVKAAHFAGLRAR